MRTGSVTGAAKLLHISQPSVSRLISDLELSAGFPLFVRVGRGLAPTRESRRFHQAVESHFLGVERLVEAARQIRDSAGDDVSVGTIPALVHDLVPQAVAELRVKYPDTKIHAAVDNTPGLVEGVLLQQYEVAVVSGAFPRYDLCTLIEVLVPYVCLVPTGHPVATQAGVVDISKLHEEEFVIMAQPFPEHSSLEGEFSIQHRISSGSSPAIAALARHTGCFALVDPYTARAAEAMGGVVTRAVQQQLQFPYAVVCKAEETLSRSARHLADTLCNRLQRNSEELFDPS